MLSLDLEDIIAVIDGRKELFDEIELSKPAVQQYLRSEFQKLVNDSNFFNCLGGSLSGAQSVKKSLLTD